LAMGALALLHRMGRVGVWRRRLWGNAD